MNMRAMGDKMKLGIALVSRILTGEEPCLRKVQLQRRYELPVNKKLVEYTVKHEYLVSQIVNKFKNEVVINRTVEIDLDRVKLVGKIDVILVRDIPVIIEVKSGSEKASHHVQLWLYMIGYGGITEGILRYSTVKYWYSLKDIPCNLLNLAKERVRPLLTDRLLPPVRNSHCSHCQYKQICELKERR